MFYPSPQGNAQIKLYENALVKLQAFHSAFGEDAQIYSKEEIVKEFQMYDSNVKDSIDEKLELIRELRDVYNHNRELYDKVKQLPLKSRVARSTGKHQDKTIVYVSSDVKTEFYLATDKTVVPIDFLQAVKYLKASPEERAIKVMPDSKNYSHVNRTLGKYTSEYIEAADDASINRIDLDNISKVALNFLRRICQTITDSTTKVQCKILTDYINKGIYTQLPRRLRDLSKSYKGDKALIKADEEKLRHTLSELIGEYQTMSEQMQEHAVPKISDPKIIISETFI